MMQSLADYCHRGFVYDIGSNLFYLVNDSLMVDNRYFKIFAIPIWDTYIQGFLWNIVRIFFAVNCLIEEIFSHEYIMNLTCNYNSDLFICHESLNRRLNLFSKTNN